MISPFDIWSPIIHAPFSGDVTQEITPRVLSPEIKGSAAIEQRVQTEVASYGKQLGKVLDALQALAARTDTDLPEIDALVTAVDAVKRSAKEALRTDAEDALARLKDADPEGWSEVMRGAAST